MEEEKQLAGEDRLSGEIVEVYRQPLPGEVVERYSRPLPGRPAAPGQPRRRRRTGLWIFLACLAVVLGVAAGSWIWYLLPAGGSAEPVFDISDASKLKANVKVTANGITETASAEKGLSASANPLTATSAVIKATGDNSAVVFAVAALAVAGVLGMAVRKERAL